MKNMPKIELHCHLDGSVRVKTMLDIAVEENIKIPTFEMSRLTQMVQVPEDCKSLNEYLQRFEIPNMVMQSKKALKRITFELLEDCSMENIKYIEIRFAPQFHTKGGLNYEQIIESVIEGINEAEAKYEIKANIILSIMRIKELTDGLEVVEAGRKYLKNKVVAIDLAGPEEENFANKYEDIIIKAKEYGYNVTIHAGEAASGKNVEDAINILGATRIGHGINIQNIDKYINLVKEKNVLLEVCPTSNIQTKAIDEIKNHPVYKFYKDEILVNVSTDNRTVSDINLTHELEIFKDLGADENDFKKMYLDSVKASFADDETKKWMIDRI